VCTHERVEQLELVQVSDQHVGRDRVDPRDVDVDLRVEHRADRYEVRADDVPVDVLERERRDGVPGRLGAAGHGEASSVQGIMSVGMWSLFTLPHLRR
jgi:hypothetical protein